MEAKETADKIFNQHYMVLLDSDSDKGNEVLVTSLAKQCAFIDVENTISILQWADASYDLVACIDHYIEVKSELEKL